MTDLRPLVDASMEHLFYAPVVVFGPLLAFLEAPQESLETADHDWDREVVGGKPEIGGRRVAVDRELSHKVSMGCGITVRRRFAIGRPMAIAGPMAIARPMTIARPTAIARPMTIFHSLAIRHHSPLIEHQDPVKTRPHISVLTGVTIGQRGATFRTRIILVHSTSIG